MVLGCSFLQRIWYLPSAHSLNRAIEAMGIGQRPAACYLRLVDLEVLAGRAMCLPLVADDGERWVISREGGGGQRIFAVGGANHIQPRKSCQARKKMERKIGC